MDQTTCSWFSTGTGSRLPSQNAPFPFSRLETCTFWKCLCTLVLNNACFSTFHAYLWFKVLNAVVFLHCTSQRLNILGNTVMSPWIFCKCSLSFLRSAQDRSKNGTYCMKQCRILWWSWRVMFSDLLWWYNLSSYDPDADYFDCDNNCNNGSNS